MYYVVVVDAYYHATASVVVVDAHYHATASATGGQQLARSVYQNIFSGCG